MMEITTAPAPVRPPKKPPEEPLIRVPGNGQPVPQDRKPPDPDEAPEIDIEIDTPVPRVPPVPPEVPERRVRPSRGAQRRSRATAR